MRPEPPAHWKLNAVNTFTGGLTIAGATARLFHARAAGDPANVITIAASANTASASTLEVAGGRTIANNIVIAAAASPLAAMRTLQQYGGGQGTVSGTIHHPGNIKRRPFHRRHHEWQRIGYQRRYYGELRQRRLSWLAVR
jgi:hypothetical protein